LCNHDISECWIAHPELRKKKENSTGSEENKKTPFKDYKKDQYRNKSKNESKLNNVFEDEEYSSENEVNVLNDVNVLRQRNIKGAFCRTNIYVNGHEVEAIFDSGATRSVLPKSFCNKHSISLKKGVFKCQLADGTNYESCETKKIDIVLFGTITKLEMIVLDRKTALLGIDWLNSNNAYVKTSDLTLNFEKRIISLAEEEDPDEVFNIELAEINSVDDEDENEIEQDYEEESWETKPPVKLDYTIREKDNLSEAQLIKLNEMLEKNKDGFASSICDLGKPCKLLKFKIALTDDIPVSQRYYNVSIAEREIINGEVRAMLEAGVIRRSFSPYKSPVVLIKKKDKSYRFCVDYRKLNKKTIKDNYPIPMVQNIFRRLKDSSWFTILDLKSGYWQLAMDKESIHKTAFVTCDGSYEFVVLPFGVANGPAMFCRLMEMILGELPYVEIYLDDILIHSNK
jgi:hypothetical protein